MGVVRSHASAERQSEGDSSRRECIQMERKLAFFHDIYADDEEEESTGAMVAGRIVKFHAREDLFGSTGAIDTAKMMPISRLGGIGYGRTTDAFEVLRSNWKDYQPLSASPVIENTAAGLREGFL